MNVKIMLADLRASLVVFLVALPLGLGISMASGFPPIAGLLSGIIGGLVVGLIGGSPLQVSGAAAGLTVLVWNGVQTLGFERLAWAILLAGVLQSAAAALRLGRWFRAISPTVLQALLSGIGLLILISQLYVLFNQKAPGGGLTNLLGVPQLFSALTQTLGWQAALIGLLTIVCCHFSPYWFPRVQNIVPAPLLAIIGASALAAWIGYSGSYVQIPRDILGQLNFLSWESFPGFKDGAVWLVAAQLALIASAESLLCASAVDRLHDGPRTQYERELFAQGVGNMLCGLIGCLPLTGVIVRSSANVQAGAQTRVSACLHGLWLLLAVVAIPQLLETIPLTALAGILLVTGWKLFNLKQLLVITRNSRSEGFILLSSLTLIVTYDLLAGVVWGALASALTLLWRLSHLDVNIQDKGPHVQVSISGVATFLRLPHLAEALDRVPPGATIEVCARQLMWADRSARETFQTWKQTHERRGGIVRIGASLIASDASS